MMDRPRATSSFRCLTSVFAAVLLFLAPVSVAFGNHVEVTNGRAVLRADHAASAERIRGLDEGERLDLRPNGEVDGWFPVFDHVTRRDAWIFRGFVRLRQGERPNAIPPSTSPPEPALARTESAPPGGNAPGLPHAFYLIEQAHYTAGFDPRLKIPVWIQYLLRESDLDGPAERGSLDFEPHADVPESLQADDGDYAGSGSAKGHMAAAEDMTRSDAAIRETFFYTNAAPQIGPSFNGSKWSVLERKTREWVRARGELIVIIGPVFDRAPPDEPSDSRNSEEAGWVKYKTIGEHEIAVAHGFFRVVYDPERLEALAFLLPHRDVTGNANPVEGFVVSIADVERRAGIDLLPDLPDDFEVSLEAARATELWAGIKTNGDVQPPIPVPSD